MPRGRLVGDALGEDIALGEMIPAHTLLVRSGGVTDDEIAAMSAGDRPDAQLGGLDVPAWPDRPEA